MLSGGTDGLYRAILAGPHKNTCRVEVWAEGVRIDDFGDVGVPFTSGTISATLTSRVARTVSMSLTEEFYPESSDGLLAPYGNYIKVFSGVEGYGGLPYEWQTFYGRIDDINQDSTGNVVLDAVDLAGDVQDSFFTVPQQSNTSLNVAAQFVQLIENALPGATFGTFDPTYQPTPNLIWQTDRGSACDQLASAANMFWYPLANGDFVMRVVAWDTDTPPLMTLYDGPGGTMATWTRGRSRRNVFNAPTVVGEQADGSTPVFGSASDGDPTSPTYVGGKFGVKGKLISVQTATSSPQCSGLARGFLHTAKALTEQWSITHMADASIELGDPFQLQGTLASGRTTLSSTQVVTSYAFPMGGDGMMSIALRAQTPGATEQFV